MSGTIATKTSDTSIGWIIPTSFYTKIPNAKSGQGTITCETYSGDILIGTANCTFNVFVTNSNPTVTATAVDSNATTKALTGNENKLIRYYSNAKVIITATAKNSATISSQKVVCGAKSATTVSSTLNNIESGTFDISCVDSRGFTASTKVTKTLINYIRLAFTQVEIERPSTTSNTVNASVKGNYFNDSFGTVANILTLKWRWRVENGTWSAYTTVVAAKNGNTFSYDAELGTNFDFEKEYEFEFVATDKLTTETSTKTVTRGLPIIDIGENDVDVNGDIKQRGVSIVKLILQTENPVGHIRIETTNVNPATYLGFGTWTLWGKGRVPVGVDTADDDFKTVEKTGGSKTHTLTVEEMPTHVHNYTSPAYWSSDGTTTGGDIYGTTASTTKQFDTRETKSSGSGKAHSIVQPYITCYMWKRTE